MRAKFSVAVAALFVAVSMAACGETTGGGDEHTSSDVPASADFNQADVDFATNMIQHHAQALTMVDLVDKREVSPQLRTLAEQIRMAQGPEIETMVDWLREWAQPVPETVRDHASAHGDGMEMDSDLPGIVTHDELQNLEKANAAEFEPKWLELMIRHHQGAVEMAKAQKSDGEYAEAIKMAETIIAAQEDEIATMKNMLGGS